MAHLDRPQQESTRIADRYYEWSSNDQCLKYYNGEENVLVPLDNEEFILLEHYHVVKGFHQASSSGITSNEVFQISKEPMKVRSFKGGLIAEGLYKDNKQVINNAGGKYHRSIYAVDSRGEIVNIAFKGSALGGAKSDKAADGKEHKGWSDFYNDNNQSIWQGAFKLGPAIACKSGNVTYSIPNFQMGSKFTTDVYDNVVMPAAKKLQDYMDNYRNGSADAKHNVTNEPAGEIISRQDF